jgi:hypothetical protein
MGWWLAALLLVCARTAGAADATLFRVFFTDGATLVSYGEPARIGDRIVFSMPVGALPNPPLHLVNLPAATVDWERTNAYAESARAAHYLATRAEFDYAALSNRVAQALDDLTHTQDINRRLEIAENARRVLAAWPRNHHYYRVNEVRQMLSLLDEAIADLRAATGDGRFDLSLTAFTDPPPQTEQLAEAPTAQERIEFLLTAARIADVPAERTAILQAALTGLDRSAADLPAEWTSTVRSAAAAELEAELRLDRAYRDLTTRIMGLADRRARAADVRGLTRLVADVESTDRSLGGKRPDAVYSLLAALEDRLDAARRLRLARDRWALRLPEYRKYHAAVRQPLDLFERFEESLEDIKLLAGSSAASLASLQEAVSEIVRRAETVVPPDEFRAAHALLVSAAQLAGNAARIRREATMAGDIARAWDASSAAAGALMLVARARTDMQTLLEPPQLR